MANIEIRIDNVTRVLNTPARFLPDVLERVFARLVEPDQDGMFLQTYCGAIRQRLERDVRPPGQLGFDSFGEAAFGSGVVETMLTITQTANTTMAHATAAYHALNSLHYLLLTGNMDDRADLLHELLEHNLVDICLQKALNHPLVLHRNAATSVLRAIASESLLGAALSSKQTSDAILAMARFILSGPKIFIDQFRSPSTTWQSAMTLGSHGIAPARAAKYAPRYYAMAQECAIWVVQGLLCRSPPPSPQFRLEVIQHNPEVIDLLFQCALLPRVPWYPETQVDSVTCEVLVTLFAHSLDDVPGVEIPRFTEKTTDFAKAEREALAETFRVLMSRPKWSDKILAVWKKIEDENPHEIQKLFERVQADYLAQCPPDEEALRTVYEYRGASRICMLRLIGALSHVPDIATSDLVSFLRIAHLGSQEIPRIDRIQTHSELNTLIERAMEVHRSPMYTLSTLDSVEAPTQIADEGTLGPIAFMRLLTILAEREVLDTIATWEALPSGSSTKVSISDVKKAVSQDVIRKVFALAIKRIEFRRETGRTRFEEDDLDYAGAAYANAAELAAAVISAQAATRKFPDEVRPAHRELVLCLGNAAEMAMRLRRYERAYGFAAAAVEAAQKMSIVDKTLVAKNQRRRDNAAVGITAAAEEKEV